MKMDLTAFIVILLLSNAGTYIVKDNIDAKHYEKLPPKVQTINQYQTTENKNTSIQESSQAQITIVSPMTNFNVNYNGKTNIAVTKSHTTNRIVKTNK